MMRKRISDISFDSNHLSKAEPDYNTALNPAKTKEEKDINTLA